MSKAAKTLSHWLGIFSRPNNRSAAQRNEND
jgi:hypothetical protein